MPQGQFAPPINSNAGLFSSQAQAAGTPPPASTPFDPQAGAVPESSGYNVSPWQGYAGQYNPAFVGDLESNPASMIWDLLGASAGDPGAFGNPLGWAMGSAIAPSTLDTLFMLMNGGAPASQESFINFISNVYKGMMGAGGAPNYGALMNAARTAPTGSPLWASLNTGTPAQQASRGMEVFGTAAQFLPGPMQGPMSQMMQAAASGYIPQAAQASHGASPPGFLEWAQQTAPWMFGG